MLVVLTMPSPSLLMPWSRIFSRALSKASSALESGGPSRINLSRDMASAAIDRLLKVERLPARAGSWWTTGASLLARPLWGDRLLLTFRLAGETGLCCCGCCCCCSCSCSCCCCSSLCCEMSDGWFVAFAPRLWADCSRRRARWVPGDGGGCRVVVLGGGNAGTDSLIGLGITASGMKDTVTDNLMVMWLYRNGA